MLDPAALDAVEQTWRESRGVIFVACHVGNNEVIAAGVGARAGRLSGVADDSTFPELFAHLRDERARWGIHGHPVAQPARGLRGPATPGDARAPGRLGLPPGGHPGPPLRRLDDAPGRDRPRWPGRPGRRSSRSSPDGCPTAGSMPRSTARSTCRRPSPPTSCGRRRRSPTRSSGVIAAAPDQWYSFKPMWPETAAESAELEARAARTAGAG